MSECDFVSMVREYYNKNNSEVRAPCRLNDEDLPRHYVTLFYQLSETIRSRYQGCGLCVPEKLEGKRVLDIGCGAGSLVFILSKLVGPDGSVVGVDLSDECIATAKAESDYHCKLWGYSKPNFEFFVGNAERLDELNFEPESFDVIVSNGLFGLLQNGDEAYRQARGLLKTGGQFYFTDVFSDRDPPKEYKHHEILCCEGFTGSCLRWDRFRDVVTKAGFTEPYLTQVCPVGIGEPYASMLDNMRYVGCGYRLFKLPEGAKRGASRVTYKGNIPHFPDAIVWDVDLTFKAGEGVEVDSELATILAFSYFRENFDLTPISSNPPTKKNPRVPFGPCCSHGPKGTLGFNSKFPPEYVGKTSAAQ